MNVLITGISGYIAQYLLKTAPTNCHITGTYYSPLTDTEKLKFTGIELIPLKLEENVSVQLNETDVDVVIHAAAVSALTGSNKNPGYRERINSIASGELASWAAKNGSRFIYLSTDIVFDGQNAPYNENDEPKPVNPYGRTKYNGELAASEKNHDSIIARLALVMGKGLGKKKNFVDWLSDHVKNNKTIPLFIDEIRTPINAKDAAKTIWKLADSKEKGIFHICGQDSVNRFDLGVKICNYLDPAFNKFKKTSLKEVAYSRPENVSMCDNRIKKIFKYTNPSVMENIESLFSNDYK